MVIKVKTGSESTILSVGAYRPARLVPNSEIVDAIDSSQLQHGFHFVKTYLPCFVGYPVSEAELDCT